MCNFLKRICIFVMMMIGTTNLIAKIQTDSFSMPTSYGEAKFEVHFKAGDEKLASRIRKIAKEDLIKVVDYFKYAPNEVVHLNISSTYRLSNGNARVFPENVINLYNFPASNREHLVVMEDWWRGLIVHEYTHIVHLDQTRGYLEDGRNIFGTIAKLPAGLVPRWFAEGIATFSESKFLKAGRLQNPLFNQELANYYRRDDSCKTLDCLDTPGLYPGGQLAYWAGANFMAYVEKMKPDSVKCLAEENSSKLPFILNKVFIYCLEQDVYTLYQNFINDFLKNNPIKKLEKAESVPEVVGPIHEQKGWILDNGIFYRVERGRYEEAIVSTDLENKVSLTQTYSHPVANLYSVINLDKETKGLIVAFHDDLNFKKTNRLYKILNAETLTEESTIDLSFDPSYLLAQEMGEYFTFSYEKDRWIYRRVKLSENEETILKKVELPFEFNINDVKLLGSLLLIKVQNVTNQENFLIQTDLDFNRQKVIFQSVNKIHLTGIKENSLLINIDQDYFDLNLNEGVVTKRKLDPILYRDLIELNENGDYRLELRDQFYFTKKHSEIYVADAEKIQAQDWTYEPTSLDALNLTSYPNLNHFKPKYWFLAFGASENVSSFGAMTSVSDPMEVHNFSGNVLFYPKWSKLGGSFSYLYDNDPMFFETNFLQDYSLTKTSSETISDKKSFDVAIKKKYEKKRMTFMPSLFFGVDAISDFISNRSVKYFGLRANIVYAANTYKDNLQSVLFSSRFALDAPTDGDSYGNFQNKLVAKIKIIDQLTFEGKFAHGKLFKSDFKTGVLYSGGVNSLDVSRWFEYYGLTYGNAYGNSVANWRGSLDYNIKNVYQGYELLPAFLREVHGIVGMEGLSTDVIYLNNKYYRNDRIYSAFVGSKLKTMLFYLAPVDIDLVLSKTFLSDKQQSNSISLSLLSELY